MFVGVTPAPAVTQESTPVRRLIRTLSLLSALSLVAAALVVLGPSPTPAAAAGSRVTTTTLNCPASVTTGATITCSVTVQDSTGKARDRSNPVGTVAFSITTTNRTNSFAVITPCTLVASGGDSATCTTAQLVILGTGAPLTVRAAFTDTANVHTDSAGTDTVTATAPSNPVTYLPRLATSGGRGNTVDVYGAACTATGGQWGGFGNTVDPNTSSSNQQFLATSTRADGALVASIPIPAESVLGTTYARFYCASAPVTSIGAPQITWLGPLITYTVVANPISARTGPQVVLPRSIRPRLPFVGVLPSSGRAVVPAAAGGVVVTQDPNALPAKDVLGLTGDVMAQLKARVDRVEAASGRLTRLTLAALGRLPTRAFVDAWMPAAAAGDLSGLQRALVASGEFRATYASLPTADFVRTAYFRVLGWTPTSGELDAAVRRLEGGSVSRIDFLGELVERPEHVAATSSRSYVLAAFTELSTIVPNQAALERFTGELTDLRSEVQVIEDIAISRAAPATWLARGVGSARI